MRAYPFFRPIEPNAANRANHRTAQHSRNWDALHWRVDAPRLIATPRQDLLVPALLLLSLDGRVLYRNAEAESLVAKHPSLACNDGRLSEVLHNQALRAGLAKSSGLLGEAHPCVVPISDESDCQLVCLPTPPLWANLALGLLRGALLLIREPVVPNVNTLWQQLYGFSQAQTRLAEWLLQESCHYPGQFDWLAASLAELCRKTDSRDPDSLLVALRMSSGLN